MANRFFGTIKAVGLLLVLTMLIVACDGSDSVSLETAVAQTIEARDAVDLQVEQTVAAALAAQETTAQTESATESATADDTGGLDIADPNSGIEPIKPTSDPNLASGTPQLRVNVSSANVRNGPGTIYLAISTLLKDSVVKVIAKNRDGSWFLIELSEVATGWIADSVTDPVVVADMANVAVAVTIPAPPTPTATATPTNTPVPTATPTQTVTPAVTGTATATPASQATFTPTATATATENAPVPIPSTIVIINNTAVEVCFLFVDLSSDPWTVDRLGSNTLMPGFQISLDFPAGTYDLMAQDCSSNIISDLFQVSVSGAFTWDIR